MGGERERQTDNGPVTETETIRQTFDSDFGRFMMGRIERPNAEGTTTEVRAYEFILDPHSQPERRGTIATFALRALAAGYSQAIAPIVMPGVGFRASEEPLVAVYWFLAVPPDITSSVVNQ